MSSHVVEIWEMVGGPGTLHTPACLNCGWIGSDGSRAEAEHEGRMHERGERHPWQLEPRTISPWHPGDPTTHHPPSA